MRAAGADGAGGVVGGVVVGVVDRVGETSGSDECGGDGTSSCSGSVEPPPSD